MNVPIFFAGFFLTLFGFIMDVIHYYDVYAIYIVALGCILMFVLATFPDLMRK